MHLNYVVICIASDEGSDNIALTGIDVSLSRQPQHKCFKDKKGQGCQLVSE